MTAAKVTWTRDKADAALAPYREAKQKALCLNGSKELEMVLLHASRIPGMCPDEKIERLSRIASDCKLHGDIVEIGTWWGKSALVLLLLSRAYGIGNVLCVDPWTDEDLVQGVPAVDEASAALSAEEAFEVFKMNLLPYKQLDRHDSGDFNYLRMTSEQANTFWHENPYNKSYETPEFGVTWIYGQRIALLHIDGNHAYEKVKQDVELWAPLVLPGGWVVIDDYDWRHGDGPRRAADELICRLTTELGKPAPRHFVVGGAMFIQMKEDKP